MLDKYLEMMDAARCLADVRLIIEICASHNECTECPFRMSERKKDRCMFGDDYGAGTPNEWDVPVINNN